MSIEELNALPPAELATKLMQCCAAQNWYKPLAAKAPFSSSAALLTAADALWATCETADFLEAFTAHPKIGDVDSLAKKFAATKAWAGNEQALVAEADMQIIRDLAEGNTAYEQKFGFIFIVFATGKTAAQMLELLRARLPNTREEELKNAAIEQHKITILRINKLLGVVS
jgi:2-oxo-4-hydroxy-4-carboxy-5-ureidoimidazoline decarboxylase